MTESIGLSDEELQSWIGRSIEEEDLITAAPVADYAATMDWDRPTPKEGDPIPPGAHWFFFHDRTRQSELDSVGLPKRGDFLPPVTLARRMNAGNRMEFLQPLHIGEKVIRKTEIADITPKTGATGQLVFIVARNTISGERGPALIDDRTIVYREAAKPGDAKRKPTPPPDDAAWKRSYQPDPIVMFRFSALTFNASRIHYDYKYVTETEGYPGLIVNARLTTSLLMELCLTNNSGKALAEVATKFIRPLYDFAPFTLAGKPNQTGDGAIMWVTDPDGATAMISEMRFA
jgi:3-methylfumaryl-CoA hydratase